CGLLVGAALLVFLADSLDRLVHSWRADHLCLIALSSTVLFALIDNVLLPHDEKALLRVQNVHRLPPLAGVPTSRLPVNERSTLLSAASKKFAQQRTATPTYTKLNICAVAFWLWRMLIGGVALSASAFVGLGIALALPLTLCNMQVEFSLLAGACFVYCSIWTTWLLS
ncbi:MAG: hypothetical protein SGPRY_014182, partial [Prymnesium sp.]